MSSPSAWAEIDLGAVRANARRLASLSRPAQVCAVVKANGYGHGAVEVARAALEGGASWLAVGETTTRVVMLVCTAGTAELACAGAAC